VSPHREKTLDVLRTRLIARFERLGRVAPPPIDIDVLLHAFEYVGFRVAMDGADDDWARLTMARIALVLLGTEADLDTARAAIPNLFRPAPSP